MNNFSAIYRNERVGKPKRRGGETVTDRRVHRSVISVPVTRRL